MLTLLYRQRRLTFMVIILILVAGIGAFTVIPRQEDPSLAELEAGVVTRFPGASAERVEALVTEKIETALIEIAEIKKVVSRNRTGISSIDITLEDNIPDSSSAWSKIRTRLAEVETQFPRGVRPPEFTQYVTSAYTFLVGFRWIQDDDPQLDILYRLAKELEQRLAALPGTREVKIFGKAEEEILVTIPPTNLTMVGLSAVDVATRISNADSKIPAGQLRGRLSNVIIEVAGELSSVERIRQIPLKSGTDGGLLRVRDVAEVKKALREPLNSLVLVDGTPGMVVAARISDNLRVNLWSDQAKRLLSEYSESLPLGVTATIIFDQSRYTDERLRELSINLLLGAAAVIVVLFFMMGWKSSILVSLALPLSIALVLALLKILGITLHQISVIGLIIALGLLIDNAIVSVDEYMKRRLDGQLPRDAIKGTVSYLFVPLSASTITTALAFMPLVIMPGATGEFVRAMGIAVILSISASLLLSLTIIPALAGYMDAWLGNSATTGFWNNGISTPRLSRWYKKVLGLVVMRPALGIAVSLILPVLGFYYSSELIEQFFPPADRNQFQVQMKLLPATPLAGTEQIVKRARKIIHAHPEVRESHWFIGENPPRVYYNTTINQTGNSNFAQAFVNTGSPEQTASLVPVLQQELMREFPNAMVLALPYEQGPPFEAPIEILVFGRDLDTLRILGEQLRKILSETDNVTFTQASISGGRPTLRLYPDEDKINRAGLRLNDVAEWLNTNLEGVTGGTLLEGTEELPVRVRVGATDRSDLSRIVGNFVIPTQLKSAAADAAHGLPLNAVTELRLEPVVDAISRHDRQRVNTVHAFLTPYSLPGASIADFKKRLAKSGFVLPPEYKISYGGDSKETADAQDGLLSSVIPLLVIMVGTIVLAFNSFRMAGIIGLVAVFSIGLALLTLWLFSFPLGFMAVIGTMGLVGLAINDSIVVLTGLRADAGAMRAEAEAIVEVVMDSTRHIISTTLTTLGGFLPLIIWGGNFWPPLAIAVAGGMVGASILALIFVPSMFAWVTRRDVRHGAAKSSPH